MAAIAAHGRRNARGERALLEVAVGDTRALLRLRFLCLGLGTGRVKHARSAMSRILLIAAALLLAGGPSIAPGSGVRVASAQGVTQTGANAFTVRCGFCTACIWQCARDARASRRACDVLHCSRARAEMMRSKGSLGRCTCASDARAAQRACDVQHHSTPCARRAAVQGPVLELTLRASQRRAARASSSPAWTSASSTAAASNKLLATTS